MRPAKLIAFLLCFEFGAAIGGFGQTPSTPPKPDSDVLIFVDGERLIGHLESATGSVVVFKSDMAGEVTVDWSKIQELRSPQQFAAIRKDSELRTSSDAAAVPQGAVAMTNQQLEVQGVKGLPQTIPVGDLGTVVDEASFQQALANPGFTEGWKGGATAGVSLIQATQNTQTFTSAVNLVRTVPAVNWLNVRRRTLFNVNQAYSKIRSPGLPAVKTALYHIDAEEQWYLSPRLFAFAAAGFDHNFSQGLRLQQSYGGGLGFVVLKDAQQELDLKASIDYIDQRFEISSQNRQLVGSIFRETYTRTFPRAVLLDQQAGITGSWNETNAYSAFASAGLTFPVYHRFGLTLGLLNTFLNDPPPGFKKNSFQVTAGATYLLK